MHCAGAETPPRGREAVPPASASAGQFKTLSHPLLSPQPLEKSFLLIPAELWTSLRAIGIGSQEKTICGISWGGEGGWYPLDTPWAWVSRRQPHTLQPWSYGASLALFPAHLDSQGPPPQWAGVPAARPLEEVGVISGPVPREQLTKML